MATIASLSISLTANTKKFRTGMKSARFAVRNLSKSMALATTKVIAFGGSIAAVAGGAGLVALIRSQFQIIDSTAKVSDRLGIATDKLVGMQFASNLAGIASNKLELSLQRMTRRVAEAAQGMGEAQKALKELNIDAKELSKLSPDKQFRKIAEALGGVTAQSDKIRLGFKLFDSEGVDLIRLTVEQIDQAQKKAREMGLAFSRVDAAKIEAANDAFLTMRTTISAIAGNVAIGLAPVLEAAADRMAGIGRAAQSVRDFVAGAMQSMAVHVALFGDGLRLSSSTVQTMRAQLAGVLASMTKMISRFAGFWGQLFSKAASAIKASFFQVGANVFGIIADILGQFEKVDDAIRQYLGIGRSFTFTLAERSARTLQEFSTQQAGNAATEFNKPVDLFKGSAALNNLTKALRDVASGARESAKATNDFVRGGGMAEQARNFFEEIKNEQFKFEQQFKNGSPLDVANLADSVGGGGSPGFGTIKARNFSFSGLQGNKGKPTVVTDPAIKESNKILDKIFRRLPGSGVTGAVLGS